MSVGLAVVQQELLRHAAALEGLAGQARQGLEPAAATAIEGRAFGLMCAFLGATLQPAREAGLAAARHAVGGVELSATQLREVGRLLEGADADVAGAVGRLHARLEGV